MADPASRKTNLHCSQKGHRGRQKKKEKATVTAQNKE
jgi:hypothetical protein